VFVHLFCKSILCPELLVVLTINLTFEYLEVRSYLSYHWYCYNVLVSNHLVEVRSYQSYHWYCYQSYQSYNVLDPCTSCGKETENVHQYMHFQELQNICMIMHSEL